MRGRLVCGLPGAGSLLPLPGRHLQGSSLGLRRPVGTSPPPPSPAALTGGCPRVLGEPAGAQWGPAFFHPSAGCRRAEQPSRRHRSGPRGRTGEAPRWTGTSRPTAPADGARDDPQRPPGPEAMPVAPCPHIRVRRWPEQRTAALCGRKESGKVGPNAGGRVPGTAWGGGRPAAVLALALVPAPAQRQARRRPLGPRAGRSETSDSASSGAASTRFK